MLDSVSCLLISLYIGSHSIRRPIGMPNRVLLSPPTIISAL